MVEAQADGEDRQNADHLGPGIKAMDSGSSVEIEENIHLISIPRLEKDSTQNNNRSLIPITQRSPIGP